MADSSAEITTTLLAEHAAHAHGKHKKLSRAMKARAALAEMAGPASYSWNIFRYVGDCLHLFGIGVLLFVIGSTRSVAGISKSTQILYFLVFITRYLDLMDHSQTAYLVAFKITYIATSGIALFLFSQFKGTYERHNDTANLTVIITPCAVAAVIFADDWSPLEILWTFSEFVEGFAMVPQYIFCYRESKSTVRLGTSLYVISMGGYRVFYAMNWIYKKIQMPKYHDFQSWVGGVIEIAFFIDFLSYRFTGNSVLRSMVLTVDTKINEISDKVELKVLGTTRAERADPDGCEMRRRRRAAEEDSLDV